ncbi:hypothetical protein NW766_010125 [Fusarium irregulare]|uniref:Uncharacterized protein n=1 Tax=Fusarium irregulare TaxID=2494466 RepID=A0A9W8U6Z1_9HYPO|nr:hypothetical protein NW766_010125 [Fusarium irregulare]
MQFSFLLAALAISASAAPTPQLNAQVLNDLVDVNSDNLAGLSALLGGLGVTAGTDDAPLKVLTPLGPGGLPGTKAKRQLNAQVLNDLVDVNSDNLAGLSALLGGLGVTAGTDDAPLKVLTPLGPGGLPGTKAKRQLNAQVLNDLVDVNSDNLAGLSALLGGLGVTLGTDDAPLKVLTPLGPGAPSLPGTKREAEAEEKNA